ncbi:MAG TPA: transposase [Burkholderiales bacterium]|nr:transposase [Burkholderiales bacterium]
MPRLACPEQARIPLHVVQRGRARAACFSCAGDRLAYLESLRECAPEAECSVHAWALMGNHVHLLFTSVRERGAARLVPALAARYARHLASEYGHADAVWEEPYDATPVCTRAQLLACMRYVEENPVRAGLAPSPGAWRWSSYRCNALGEEDALVTPHPHYYSLGRSPGARRAAYAALFTEKRISSAHGRGSHA